MTGTRQQRSLWCQPVLHEAIIALQAATRSAKQLTKRFPLVPIRKIYALIGTFQTNFKHGMNCKELTAFLQGVSDAFFPVAARRRGFSRHHLESMK
jgi:hypothetical protein